MLFKLPGNRLFINKLSLKEKITGTAFGQVLWIRVCLWTGVMDCCGLPLGRCCGIGNLPLSRRERERVRVRVSEREREKEKKRERK